MSSRQNGRSILQGLDLGKLDQTAMLTLGKTIHDQVEENGIGPDVFAALQASLQRRFTNKLFNDLPYIPPEPHLKSKVDRIIDGFWAYPGEGHMYLYLEQLRKNPITRDLFKSKSTTHHYPWYRRGSKY